MPSSFLFLFFQIVKSIVHSPDTIRSGTVTKSNGIGFAFSQYHRKMPWNLNRKWNDLNPYKCSEDSGALESVCQESVVMSKKCWQKTKSKVESNVPTDICWTPQPLCSGVSTRVAPGGIYHSKSMLFHPMCPRKWGVGMVKSRKTFGLLFHSQLKHWINWSTASSVMFSNMMRTLNGS